MRDDPNKSMQNIRVYFVPVHCSLAPCSLYFANKILLVPKKKYTQEMPIVLVG